MTSTEIITRLNALKDPEKVIFKQKKFGVVANNSLGVYHKDLKALAKEIGMNSALAIELFDTGIYEGRLMCSKLCRPKELTFDLVEKWTATFENWEICDSFSMGVYARSPLAVSMIEQYKNDESEFERRAAFATMAGYCMADKKASNDVYEQFLPWLLHAATDDRIYVKKAVNWALRSIGKRNRDLNKLAIDTAKKMLEMDSKSAIWIAKDAIKELAGESVNVLDYPRSIYRP
ncbi:MAG TPA: DNA alkylation repair protein [Flavobacteriales bacterium]|nr:DNA alkylation repair protein [Flavobacteriales bacterium]